MNLQKIETMRISDSQRDAPEYGREELESLARLIERILDRNPDATVKELRDLSILWELILETSKKLRMIIYPVEQYRVLNRLLEAFK
jgi:hypothetical protein